MSRIRRWRVRRKQTTVVYDFVMAASRGEAVAAAKRSIREAERRGYLYSDKGGGVISERWWATVDEEERP